MEDKMKHHLIIDNPQPKIELQVAVIKYFKVNSEKETDVEDLQTAYYLVVNTEKTFNC